MKSKFILFAFLFIIVSCSSKEHSARNAVKKYLQETLADPKSYESVEFGKLEGGPEMYTITHKYKYKPENGELALQYDTFCLNHNCRHAISVKYHNSVVDDLIWAIKWNNYEKR